MRSYKNEQTPLRKKGPMTYSAASGGAPKMASLIVGPAFGHTNQSPPIVKGTPNLAIGISTLAQLMPWAWTILVMLEFIIWVTI